jgi:uncharacterized protein (DUF4415 family)
VFEWDPRRAEANAAKYGVSFEDAVTVTRSREVAMRKRSGSSARGGRAAASVRRTRRQIDFSDIPDSSAEQLKAMRRVGRPRLGDEPRQLIAIRVDPGVLDQFRKEARRRRVGYQTLINEVLARHVRKDVAED